MSKKDRSAPESDLMPDMSDMIKAFLPIEAIVQVKIFKTKDGGLAIKFKEVEEPEGKKDAEETEKTT